MTDTTPRAFGIPDDVWAAAKARADTEHRTITDIVVLFLLAYGAPGRRRSTARRRAWCPACGREVMLRRDGLLAAHRPSPEERRWCEGSHG